MAINLRRTVNKEKLKAKFEAEAQSGQGPSDYLPYFKLKPNDSLIIRFLSDANPKNQDFFTYTEEVFNFNGKNMKFDGVTRDCPAAKISANLFSEAKAAGEETAEGKEIRDRALKFYKKRKFLANAYIVDAPEYFWAAAGLDPDNLKDRVKVVSLPKKSYEGIKDSVMDEDFNDLEFYNFGDDVVNYKMTVKKNQGGYNDYSTSKFEIKPKDLDLNDADVDVIADCLKDLSTIFKLYSLDDFNEAIDIDIEMNGGGDDAEGETKTTAKKASKPAEESAKTNTKKNKKAEPEDNGDDGGSDDGTSKKYIKSLRSGILSKLKITEED